MSTDVETTRLAVPGCSHRVAASVRRALAALKGYMRTRSTRPDAAELTECQLRDIGMTRAEADMRSGRSSWFWQ